MPLNIAIIGAGIGGLTAAGLLRDAGHNVTVYEKSAFATEIGAAVVLAPNGSRVLSRLGFQAAQARPTDLASWETVDGYSLASLSSIDLSDSVQRFGQPFFAFHRVDLHRELMRVALKGKNNGDTNVAATQKEPDLRCSAAVREVDPKGKLWLENGEEVTADFIIGADGVHSVARRAVIAESEMGTKGTGMSAFRMLVPTEKAESEQDLRWLMNWKSGGSTIIADTRSKEERHVTWYTCQDGATQNIVGIHPTRKESHAETDIKAALVDEFRYFHADIVKLLRLADEVKRWEIDYYDPFPRMSFKKVALLGDAAHPMLPFGGQAANQAIEDAAVLGVLLKDIHDKADLVPRLQLYNKMRRNRVSIVQILSSTRFGDEGAAQDRLRRFFEGDMMGIPTNFQERIEHAFGYNVFTDCEKALDEISN